MYKKKNLKLSYKTNEKIKLQTNDKTRGFNIEKLN